MHMRIFHRSRGYFSAVIRAGGEVERVQDGAVDPLVFLFSAYVCRVFLSINSGGGSSAEETRVGSMLRAFA